MPETCLILVRHGQTEWNVAQRFQGQQDSPLTELGLLQARAIAQRLQSLRPDHLISSDLLRAAATGDIIADALGLTCERDPAWRERGFGELEGVPVEQLISERGAAYRERMAQDPEFADCGVETLPSFTQRIRAAMDSVALDRAGKTTVVVTHGGCVYAAARIILNLPYLIPRSLALPNSSLNVFKKRSHGWMIETWGEQPALTESLDKD